MASNCYLGNELRRGELEHEGLYSELCGKSNLLVRRTKGYTKSMEMLVYPLASVFYDKLKLNAA